MTRPFFNRERVTDFDIFDRHAHDAIGQAATRFAAGYPIDFQVEASYRITYSIQVVLTVDRIWHLVSHWILPQNFYLAETSVLCPLAFAILHPLPFPPPLSS
jgi:hypothetical protein